MRKQDSISSTVNTLSRDIPCCSAVHHISLCSLNIALASMLQYLACSAISYILQLLAYISSSLHIVGISCILLCSSLFHIYCCGPDIGCPHFSLHIAYFSAYCNSLQYLHIPLLFPVPHILLWPRYWLPARSAPPSFSAPSQTTNNTNGKCVGHYAHAHGDVDDEDDNSDIILKTIYRILRMR